MNQTKYLFVGGLVAMGFDSTDRFLLTVSHSGRGVFATETWERVAYEPELAFPEAGKAVGIGPIQGQVINVLERDETCEQILMDSPGGYFHLLGSPDGVRVTRAGIE
jgi:hypothetical protein